MGSASTTKYIKNVDGFLTEEAALTTSVGSSDANKIPALNDSGVIDTSMMDATVTSSGAPSASKLAQLDETGHIDKSLLPSGIGNDVDTIEASETLSAGDFVNVWNDFGARVRRAVANVTGKHAMGFVLSNYFAGDMATVYFEGLNNAVTGQTPGDVYLSTTPGLATSTPPSSSGNVVQPIGFASSAAVVNFIPGRPITLA